MFCSLVFIVYLVIWVSHRNLNAGRYDSNTGRSLEPKTLSSKHRGEKATNITNWYWQLEILKFFLSVYPRACISWAHLVVFSVWSATAVVTLTAAIDGLIVITAK